ncbi:MMPL family transporter [Streptomyces sp. NPDC016845]|uniref:MMPL family transporter n=1 Tax=Streptomyces sp. NPDC016845 TaxID=3364972 RepID=UPI0037B588AB
MTTHAPPTNRAPGAPPRSPRARAYAALAAAAIVTGICALLAAGTWHQLNSGGFDATATASAKADTFVRTRSKDGPPDLSFLVTTPGSVDQPALATTGQALHDRLRRHPGVLAVHSYWQRKDPGMRSADGRHAVITAQLRGSENRRAATAREVVPDLTRPHPGISVGAAGPAWTSVQATDDSEHDLITAELLSAPVVLLVLVIVFRSAVAAMLPLIVAGVTVIVTLALLRPLAALTPLSVFSTNLTAALGFGLTVDYCLFITTRYRHEIAVGETTSRAIRTAIRTAGRAAAFSSVTIAATMAALLCFPIPFLRSMACAGLVVALCAAGVSCLLLPPLLTLLGHRITGPQKGRNRRTQPHDPWRPGTFWRTTARTVTRHPALWGSAALLTLTAILFPVTHLHLGPVDERILPAGAEAHSVAQRLRATIPAAHGSIMSVTIPGNSYRSRHKLWEHYARSWSRAQPTATITTPHARYQAGRPISPGDPALGRPVGTWMNAQLPWAPGTAPADAAVRAARTLSTPAPVLVGGDAARFLDTRTVLKDGLLPAAIITVVSTALLLFVFTGSVFLPLKAIAVAALSMSACFGAVTWAFQDGQLNGLLGNFAVTGSIDPCILLLLFCIAFGLSMDYETFLLARIQEEHRRHGDNRLAVESGISHTGRLVTVAAVAVAAAMAGLATSGITLLKILGFGLTVGVLIDATLVRTLLVPASMCLMGRANWWAPARMSRMHTKLTRPASRAATTMAGR